ncbi:MAG: adenylate/guanylate cyclase domain-containing protein [Myxococcota bacterium]
MAKDGVSVERHFSAPRDLVWALLSDTNRYDRAMGLGASHYTWRTIDGRWLLTGEATQGPVAMTWTEEPYEWIEGRMLKSRRLFLSGPAKDGGVRVEVEDEGDGCRARVTAYGEAKSLVLRLLDPLVRAHLRRQMERYLDAIAEILETGAKSLAAGDTEQPVARRAQALLGVADNELAMGGTTAPDAGELRRRAERLESTPADPKVIEALVNMLSDRPDEEVSQMRPFELARQWGYDRRRVLQAFLHGTQAGLVDLNWQINCPVCRVSAQVVDSLGEVGRDVHCDACNISYGVDFGANVEAVFRCNHAIRDVQPAVFCAASPVFRPHVITQLRVEAGQTREHEVELDDGRLLLRTLGRHQRAELQDPQAPARLDVRITDDAVRITAEGRSTDGTTQLRVHNEQSESAYLSLERSGWASEAVLGSVVASQPDFVDLFATEAPAAGLDLSIGTITLLFSDLTGSTALYEELGDARAFAVVQEHFRLMTTIVARHEGAVIKTMGDAVMASFSTPQKAVAAAIEAIHETEASRGDLDIGVKLGIHEGPCLAVRANDRLDFFGTTVNLAARLQGQAGGGELVLMRDLAEQKEVAALLGDAPRRAAVAHLKGIAEDRELVAIDLHP